MIPSNITRDHVMKALNEIDAGTIPPGRHSKKFILVFKGKRYPPKYVVSIANKHANGEILNPSGFSGGQETNNFLRRLGYEIEEIGSTKKKVKSSIPPKTVRPQHGTHSERCPECKNTIEKLLKQIYGAVERDYKFEVSTNPENFRDTPYYEYLRRIFVDLQDYRENKNFVYTDTLPNCDYFVPRPGFVVEFDESQHFTQPRKLSLQKYPENLKVGFSVAQWAALCDAINAKDNDPPFRDEQRAWYDTLRDFLPEIKGLEPTVRLYSKGKQWCLLDPDNPSDIARFKNIIEGRRRDLNDWIATVVLQSDEHYSNKERMKALSEVINAIFGETSGDGVILFPGGMFCTDEYEAKTYYNELEASVKSILDKTDRNFIICVGIDGCVDKDGYAHDQIGLALSKNGIEAIGRKFYPAPQEMEHVELAENYLSHEEGKSRIFERNGIKYFMCVCYDTYGLRHSELSNSEGVNVVLNLVHCFYPKGEGPCGESYFARHGFAGASKQWECPVFGTAVFFNREIPERWPSGVYWNQGDKSTQKWKYEDNPLKPSRDIPVDIPEGKAMVRIYDLF